MPADSPELKIQQSLYDLQVGMWTTPDDCGDITYNESPHCYVGNNPISRVDPDGNTWGDIVAGIAIGVATNIIPYSKSLMESYTPANPDDYNSTLRTIDNSAAAAGAAADGGTQGDHYNAGTTGGNLKQPFGYFDN